MLYIYLEKKKNHVITTLNPSFWNSRKSQVLEVTIFWVQENPDYLLCFDNLKADTEGQQSVPSIQVTLYCLSWELSKYSSYEWETADWSIVKGNVSWSHNSQNWLFICINIRISIVYSSRYLHWRAEKNLLSLFFAEDDIKIIYTL